MKNFFFLGLNAVKDFAIVYFPMFLQLLIDLDQFLHFDIVKGV